MDREGEVRRLLMVAGLASVFVVGCKPLERLTTPIPPPSPDKRPVETPTPPSSDWERVSYNQELWYDPYKFVNDFRGINVSFKNSTLLGLIDDYSLPISPESNGPEKLWITLGGINRIPQLFLDEHRDSAVAVNEYPGDRTNILLAGGAVLNGWNNLEVEQKKRIPFDEYSSFLLSLMTFSGLTRSQIKTIGSDQSQKNIEGCANLLLDDKTLRFIKINIDNSVSV